MYVKALLILMEKIHIVFSHRRGCIKIHMRNIVEAVWEYTQA